MSRTCTRALATVAPQALCLAIAVLVTAIAVPATVAAETAYLQLQADGLEDLGPGWAYEGWVISAGMPISTGTFTVSVDGVLSRSAFAFEVSDRDAIVAFVLTIEPSPDADPAPSAVHLLGGDFSSGMAALSVGHPAALGDDFVTADGVYILNAPSAGGSASYTNGIWWLVPDAGPGPSLDLPVLPAGWAYEGWVVGPEGAMSTGRFTDVESADSDGPGVTAGPYAAPPFPGQDLVNPPVDLTAGYAAVISVEPRPDNSPAPFTLKPLVDGFIDDVGGGELQAMDNNARAFPTAVATLLDAAPQAEIAHLMLDIVGLDDLGPEWVYEGWLIVDGAPVSTGTFSVSGGVLSQRYFPTIVESLDAISSFVLTIEPAEDPDPDPSSVHLLGGDFASSHASLAIGHMAALGDDFSAIAGSYILNAPSGGGAVPYTHGIWWLDPEAGPGPTLDLPTLPDGWVYEGWVVGDDGPVSTGRFSSVEGMDSDGAGPAGGEEAFPPFPGQDFVDPARDLTSGYAAVISIEPEPDNSTAPFTLKPLLDLDIDDVGAGVPQPMASNVTPSFSSGAATLLEASTIAAGAHDAGVNQTNWRTDLVLRSRMPASRMVVVELLASGQANLMPQWTMVSLPAMASVRYGDAFQSLFDHTGTGALRVLSEAGAIDVTSRTYTVSDAGTYGQSIAAYGMEDAFGYGEQAVLIQLASSESSDSGFRTNIGLVNAGTDTIDVHVDLYDGDGSMLGLLSATMLAGEQLQRTDVLSAVGAGEVDAGFAVVWTDTPGGSFFAYASVVDNQTGDAVYVPAR